MQSSGLCTAAMRVGRHRRRLLRSLDADRAGLARRVIVAAGEKGISHVDHFCDGNIKDVSQFSDPIRLVDSGKRNVN